jgi:hypothetical protein
MTGPLITGQHLNYVMLLLTALSVAWHLLFSRGRPHDAACRCQWCVKQDADEDEDDD